MERAEGAGGLTRFASLLCERAELHPSAAFVAADLARLGADPRGARARCALLVLLLEALEQGSTRLLVGTKEARAKIAARLGQLGVNERVVKETDTLLLRLVSEAPPAAPAAKPKLPAGQLALAMETEPSDAEPFLSASIFSSGEPESRTILTRAGPYLSLARWSDAERNVARALVARRAQLASPETVLATLAAVPPLEARAGARTFVLNAEQQRAVSAALLGPTTLVTGGPGTGKTSIVVAMLRGLSRLPGASENPSLDVALAAPTGKAADRMREAIASALASGSDPRDKALSEGLVPMTLHRLLGYQPDLDRYRHHAGSRLPFRCVVVDEASMLDTMLLARLVEALAEDALLVLLGDPDQLPSVGAGSVLRDLGVLAKRFPTALRAAHLTESHRMVASDPAGAHVLSVARAVGRGQAPILSDARGEGSWQRVSALGEIPDGASLFHPLAHPLGKGALGPWLDRWLESLALDATVATTRFAALAPEDERGGMDPTEQAIALAIHRAHASRLLVITRGPGPRTGLASVNAYLGARYAERVGRRSFSGHEPGAGEPVVVIANDYLRGIYNGDTGIVVDAVLEGRPTLALALSQRGRVRLLPMLDVAPLIERAWALTVHRAQGSEHERVALLLPEVDVPRLCTREIIYTAITRAKRAVQVVGDPALLAKAIERKERRETGLGDTIP